MELIHIWTDGGGRNPGVGGWAAFLTDNRRGKIFGRFEGKTTNNRSETRAVILGLTKLRRPSEVLIHTDSMYVIRGINKLKNGDMLKTNQDLWFLLESRLSEHLEVNAVHTNGHSHDKMNNIVDKVAGYCASNRESVKIVIPDIHELLAVYNNKMKMSTLLKWGDQYE